MNLATTVAGAETELNDIDRPPPNKWTFSLEEIRESASQRDGMTYEEELSYRQQATSFVQDMVEVLNKNEPRVKITQLGMCVANVQVHRFFYFHSFKKFDFRDIAAACLFLAGKSEESPRKLSDVVTAWKIKKYGSRSLPPEAMRDACQYIVYLESGILQTLSFELNVDLPHAHVIRIMDKIDKNSSRKRITSCAYYFATDVLCVTDWAIRYSHRSIAVAVCHLVSSHAEFDLEAIFENPEKKDWFEEFDPDMTRSLLKEMEIDFLTVYHGCRNHHYASKISFNLKTSITEDLPPPPMAPILPKKVDMNQYKERMKDSKERPSTSITSPRQSFMPDLQTMNPDSTNGFRSSKYEEYKRKEEKSRSYGVIKDEQFERLDRERGREEERRKREIDRIANRQDHSTSGEKRARIGPLSTNFVSSSSVPNGNVPHKSQHQQNSSYSNQNMKISSSSSQQVAALAKKPEKPLSPLLMSSRYEASTTLTPPPLPPAMRYPSSCSDMDLEDGELE